nr:16S rRNA (guanine(527)-N(7))-methyltransferase RsmG [Nocardioides guangzhouensis]
MFSSARRSLAEAYVASLADAGVVRGLIGPREVPRLWERHVLNCAVLGEAIPEDSAVCDIGSGAGLPGLVLAIARPDLRVTLVEPLLRRTTYLSEVVADLGLDQVEVVRGRAEALHGERTFDVVTSRAVAPLGRLLDWSMPLVAPTGALVAMKGSSVSDEIEAAEPELTRWGCAVPEVVELGADVVSPPTRVLRVAWADPGKVRYGGARGQSRPRRSTKSRGRKA